MSAEPVRQLLGEIENPRPLRANAEKCVVTGWCLLTNEIEPPVVRLSTVAGVLPMTARVERTDLPSRLPGQPSAARCGFVIEGLLPAGVHLAAFEAQLPDGSWQVFKTLSLAVDRLPFVAVLDEPIALGVLRDRVRVGGWAHDPDEAITALSLRYGHREIPCKLEPPRRDVADRFPDAVAGNPVGFASRDFLVAGHGPVRLRAHFASGRTAIASTHVVFSIPTDENIGPEINLAAERIPLPGYACRHETPPSEKTAGPLNILFILHGSFASNSALHVAALANELTRHAHDCAVAVPHDLETLAHHEQPLFRGLTFAEAEQDPVFANGLGPDLIHAWTTRENVRQLAEKLRARHHAKLIVHLEDNEQEILSLSLGRSFSELEKLSSADLDRLVPAELSHPHRARQFLALADGITVVADKLRELAPANRPCQTVTPAADPRYFFPRPVPGDFRRLCGLAPGTTLLFYHGNVHASNAVEVKELYAALLRLNQAGHPAVLLRTGLDRVDFLGELAGQVAPHVIHLGQILHHRHLPPLMALADIFVQPGAPDPFNDYRFPSKLPEFFSIGRPVVLPRTNLGNQLQHGTDAYVLNRADAAGIAAAIVALRADRALYDRLSEGAVAYAALHFSWRRSAETLAKFYSTLTA